MPSDTGIPNSRPRLYMAAVAGLTAIDDQDGLIERIHGSLEAMVSQLTPRPITEFLLDAYMPEKYSSDDMIADWVPEMRRRLPAGLPAKRRLARVSHKLKRTSKGKGTAKSKHMGKRKGKSMTWAACPHKQDKARYLADLTGNPWFEVLADCQKDVLLLNLCQHSYPGLQDGVVTVMSSAQFSRICRGKFPCQVPNAKFWILGYNRLQTGAEGLMLQGVDLVDIPSFGIGAGRRWSDRFLQDLAGNAFCVYQFAVWLLACLPQVPRVAQ